MKRQGFAFIVLTMLISTLIASTTVNVADASGECVPMTPDHETFEEWVEIHNSQPLADVDPESVPLGSSFSLLPYLSYVPAERDQGWCGNCWVWAGTGILEIALAVQCGFQDRLSIQYLTSCFNGGTGPNWACCGGWLAWVASFYSGTFAVPWSNTNAHWQDGGTPCSAGATTVNCGTISTSPNYPITACTAQTITTFSVGQDTAISNIKSILHQSRGVWFAFYLCYPDDWYGFVDFWLNQDETAVWDFDPYCGHYCDEVAGHAVLCVGYNDDDPNNKYWIMLNSWGTTAGRPNGLFRVKMDIDYDCYFAYETYLYWSLYWETLDVDFECPVAPVGGLWVPVSRVELLAPWITVCSVVASVAVVVVAVKKRKS